MAVAEKKVAILSKALEHHPGNTQLLLAMLEVRLPILPVAAHLGLLRCSLLSKPHATARGALGML